MKKVKRKITDRKGTGTSPKSHKLRGAAKKNSYKSSKRKKK